MLATLLGRKIGMTRVYDETGRNIPVTVIQASPNHISQVKTSDRDGYNAIQLAFEQVKPRRSTIPMIGHDARAGLTPRRWHREVRLGAEEVSEYELGQELAVDIFEQVKFVDVIATSKGKGYAGGVKRWGFKGQPASHGVERKHRSAGSVGGRSSNAGTGRPKKGGKKAGQMGSVRHTVRSLELVRHDQEENLLIVKGPVPGPNQGFVIIREAIRLSKRKARVLAEAS